MKRERAWVVTVPVILLLGLTSGWRSNSGYTNYWFDQLYLPSFMPPAWSFPIAWTILYVLMGVAVARVIAGEGPARRLALALFAFQLLLNLAWSPVFFGLHQAGVALIIILVLILLVAITAILFWRICRAAGALMVPYLLWLFFAALLNAAIVRLNP
jgi:tryptophan-rich sensory protein